MEKVKMLAKRKEALEVEVNEYLMANFGGTVNKGKLPLYALDRIQKMCSKYEELERFQVVCDRTNNTKASMEAGLLNVRIELPKEKL